MTKEKKIVDLAELNTTRLCEQGAELELVSPRDGTSVGAFIMLAGVDSDNFRQAKKDQSSKLLRKNRSNMKLDELEETSLDLYVACTLGWRGVMIGGEEVPFSVSAARDLYRNYPWIREQVDAFIYDRANFFRD